MKPIAKIVSFLLVLSMLFSFVCCVKQPGDSKDQTTSDAATDTPSANDGSESDTSTYVETSFNAQNILGERDLANETITFYERNYNGMWTSDLTEDRMEADIIAEAIVKRNTTIEELYNVKIATIKSGGENVSNAVGPAIQSGTAEFDAVASSMRNAATLATDGRIRNLKNVENINLDASYWSPFISKQVSIVNKVFYATGDISVIDNRSVRTVFFNKTYAANLGFDNVYSLVDNNEWTMDKMFEMAQTGGSEVDGDSTRTLGIDNFGLVGASTLAFELLSTSGNPIISKDNSDVPYLSIGNTASVTVADYITRNITNNPAITTDSIVSEHFTNTNILFILVTLARAEDFRQVSDLDYGILPIPKYNSDAAYTQYSDAYCPLVYSIPTTTTGEKLDKTSFLIEALAIESCETVTPAYYDYVLKGRSVKDEQSSRMIDIILGNYILDLADVYLNQWGIRSPVISAITNGSSLSVVHASNNTRVTALINSVVNKLKTYND